MDMLNQSARIAQSSSFGATGVMVEKKIEYGSNTVGIDCSDWNRRT
jgi:hypothetical protein